MSAAQNIIKYICTFWFDKVGAYHHRNGELNCAVEDTMNWAILNLRVCELISNILQPLSQNQLNVANNAEMIGEAVYRALTSDSLPSEPLPCQLEGAKTRQVSDRRQLIHGRWKTVTGYKKVIKLKMQRLFATPSEKDRRSGAMQESKRPNSGT